MAALTTPSTRLYVLLARRAHVGLIFRRGPSKQVLTIGWNTQTHEFRMGQWFRGRIYEQRCDLSPSGERLIYFAAKRRDPHRTWTAMSRTPFLTALLMWPKGDAWGGGALFVNERTILLNHRPGERRLGNRRHLPRAISVEAFPGRPGWGEDDPIWSTRLTRDGWILRQEGTARENKGRSPKIWWEYPEPRIWSKAKGKWHLQMRILGLKERDGPWYVIEHEITDARGNIVLSLGRTDWADWSRSGEVLYAKEGRLYRVPLDAQARPAAPEELIDLSGLRFEQIIPPEEATIWDADPPQGRLLQRAPSMAAESTS
jgi:hypothetical protein